MKLNLLTLSIFAFATPAFAVSQTSTQVNVQTTVDTSMSAPQTVQEESEPESFEDSVTGVSYDLDDNGNFARIRAVGEAELLFGDRKDVRIAKQKATLRAKAAIAKFLQERVTSEEVMDAMTETMDKAHNGQTDATREAAEDYAEKITNSAEALLHGVITVKSFVNPKDKFVQIELGVSKKTLAAVGELQTKMKALDRPPLSVEQTEQTQQGMANEQGNTMQPFQGTPIKPAYTKPVMRKVKNYDNF